MRCSRTEVPSLHRHYPASLVLRTSPPPCRPNLTLAGCRLARATPPAGLPMLRPIPSSIHATANTPAEPVGARVARFPTAGSLPRFNGGSASAVRVSRPARRLLALWPEWSLNRPGRPFVIGVLQTMLLPPPSAPTATGWSDICRAGFVPAEEWRLLTAHRKYTLRVAHLELGGVNPTRFDPKQIRNELIQTGFDVPFAPPAEPDADAEHDSDDDLVLVQRFLRSFLRATALNDGTVRQRLGVNANHFLGELLPGLQQVGVVQAVQIPRGRYSATHAAVSADEPYRGGDESIGGRVREIRAGGPTRRCVSLAAPPTRAPSGPAAGTGSERRVHEPSRDGGLMRSLPWSPQRPTRAPCCRAANRPRPVSGVQSR